MTSVWADPSILPEKPGQRREVQLIPYAGDRVVYGFNQAVMGAL